MIDEWLSGSAEPADIHISGSIFQNIVLPQLPEEHGLAILDKPISALGRSAAYPYGFTDHLLETLTAGGITTVGQLANSSDKELDDIENIGAAKIKIIRETVYQAIWM
jgi:hypothetical protein